MDWLVLFGYIIGSYLMVACGMKFFFKDKSK